MKAAAHRFCSVESAQAGDPLAGTAAHAASNLLISWPRPKWSRSLRTARDMDDDLAGRINRLAASGRRVNLIDQRGRPASRHRIYLLPEGRCFDVPRDELTAFLRDLESGDDLSRWSGAAITKSLVLCCTHGRKDKCCAKFGYAAYQELASTVTDRKLPFDVWESSHLGGCRLAASVMVFPAMRKYGRVAPEQVLPLLQHEAEGMPYLPCYRGQSLLTPAQQCAEIAALEWLEARSISARLSVMAESDGSEGGDVTVQVHWHGDDTSGGLVAQCGTTELMRVDTCADLDEGPTTSMCWVVKNIRPL
ncbi:sucrase ferredoxin [Marinobacter sp. TBZ242]|uniref:Sucrase ferredoxin n=1 Tax=Marinobacter azerbaijanicus TaxID=3050455 RepID=A0ABT7IF02_9GAMM|nr:sucrase ferredoxin [Marinobacter sp. TBZ242]MDL0432744.1 sucrase ferredoxin [Marinobacter sp. TBZ242]